MGQPGEDTGYRFTDQIDHCQTHDQAGDQRNDQDWFQGFHTLRQFQLPADGFRHITGKETSDDPADKAGAAANRQHTADKARGQTRTVGNGEGDKACQYRHHQREGRAAADLHQRRRQGVFHFKRFDPEGKGERDTQAPGHYHRQHIGDAGQQVAIGARRLFFPFSSRLRFAGWLVRFGFRHRFIQLLGGFLQRQTGGGAVHRLAGEFRQVHLDIGSDDHQIRLGHLFRGDGIARPNGAAGLHLHPPAAFFGFGFDGFCRHKGVGDAGRTGGDRDNAFLPLSGGRNGYRRWRNVGLSVVFRFSQEQLRMGDSTVNIAQVNVFTIQRAIGRQRGSQHDGQFGVIRVINQLKVRFRRRGTQQGFRHVGARLSESGINNQQRFHYASPAVN
ncbi:Uncharacterised protein [Klebsiella pneumoniae]|nr:Uncharacterised protein [Klebsiella pneumoniae]